MENPIYSSANSQTYQEMPMEKLAKCRITPETEVQSHRFLLDWKGTPCFPVGELVAITGKAKSGKTYFTSLLMSLSVRGAHLGLKRKEAAPYRVVWIDTEQSEDSTKEILCQRIGVLASGDTPDMFGPSVFDHVHAYNLRRVDWQDRLQMVEQAILTDEPDLVIFDGIRDVVNDINDGPMAQKVMDRLLSLASFTNCCIVCVLHQNKAAEDKTLRGALGTELMNKSFETYECVKSKEYAVSTFTVKQTATRKYDIHEDMQFTINAQGLPESYYREPEEQPKQKRTFNYYGHSMQR